MVEFQKRAFPILCLGVKPSGVAVQNLNEIPAYGQGARQVIHI